MANTTYIVQKNDTLASVANKFKVTVDRIKYLNNIPSDYNLLYVGQELIISGDRKEEKQNNTQIAEVNNFGLISTSEKTILATWLWNRQYDTKSYQVKWTYTTKSGAEYEGKNEIVTNKYSSYPTINDTLPDDVSYISVYVRPIAKTYYVGSNEISYFIADWSSVKTYYYDSSEPVTPTDPIPMNNIKISGTKVTVTVSDIPDTWNADSIQFKISTIPDSSSTLYGISKISNNKASYSSVLKTETQYEIYYRTIKENRYSDWSPASGSFSIVPSITGEIYSVYAMNSTTVHLAWAASSSATNGYEIEYTTNRNFFDASQQLVQKANSILSEATISNLNPGFEYFFRVRPVTSGSTSSASSSKWSNIVSITIGTLPNPPTTWSSANSIKYGDSINLYWTHNTEDGSRQTEATVQIMINGDENNLEEHIIKYLSCETPNSDNIKDVSFDDLTELTNGFTLKVFMTYMNTESNVYLSLNQGVAKQIKRSSEEGSIIWNAGTIVTLEYNIDDDSWYIRDISSTLTSDYLLIDTNKYDEETLSSLQWRVKTSGLLTNSNGENIYSDWSTNRKIDVYEHPNANIYLTDVDGYQLENNVLKSFPFNLLLNASKSNSQYPVSYIVSIYTEDSYEIDDGYGITRLINKGTEIYNKRIDSNDENVTITVSASDIILKNNIHYKATVNVSMSSGLFAYSEYLFVTDLKINEYWPDAELLYDENNCTMSIRPYCNSPDNLLLSVYRINYDNTLTEISKDLDNSEKIYVTDPHPSLDLARYRIVCRNADNGSISYYDIPGYPVKEKSVIIQWDEKWSNFDIPDEDRYDTTSGLYVNELNDSNWTGSLLRLPYNIDITDDNKVDVTLVKYIGRNHPVSYYGTQINTTANWSMDIPKSDKENLYAIRRLSIYKGDVYIREPSGIGYWAVINVSYDIKHKKVTIPVSLSITRVEGEK